MTPKLITPAAVLPVSMVTAMRALRVLQGDADLAEFYLQVATEKVENYTARALVTQTFLLSLPCWPTRRRLELRRTPLSEVTSIKYYPEDGSAQAVLDPSNYRVCTNSEPGYIEFVDGITFPDIDTSRFDAVEVTFVSGYGTKENEVPSLLRAAVLMLGRNYFDNRVPVGDAKIVEMPLNVRDILRATRVESLAPLL